MNSSTTQPPAPQLALIALSPCICGAVVDQDECPYPTGLPTGDERAIFKVNCTDPNCGWSAIGYGADGARKAWNTRPQSRPEAELPEVTDEMVERALAEIGDFQFCPKLTDRKAAMRAALEAAFPQIHGDVTDAAVQKALDAQPFTEENYGTRVWQTFLPEYQEHLCKQIMRAALQAAYGQQCAATRPAEVGGDEGLRSTLTKVREFLTHKMWGNWNYMEGSEIYDDIRHNVALIDAALTPPAPGSEPDALQHKHEMGPPKSGSEVRP